MHTIQILTAVLAVLYLTAADALAAPKKQQPQIFTCKTSVNLDGISTQWGIAALEADEFQPGADEIDRYLIEGYAVTFAPEDCDPRLPTTRGGRYIGVLERLEICGGIDNYRILDPGEHYEVDQDGTLRSFEGPGVVLHSPFPICGNHDSVLVVQYLLFR